MILRRWSGVRIVVAILIVIAAEIVIYCGALAGLTWLEGGDADRRATFATAAAFASPAVLIAQVAVPVVVYRLFRPRDDGSGPPDEPPPRLPGALDR